MAGTEVLDRKTQDVGRPFLAEGVGVEVRHTFFAYQDDRQFGRRWISLRGEYFCDPLADLLEIQIGRVALILDKHRHQVPGKLGYWMRW